MHLVHELEHSPNVTSHFRAPIDQCYSTHYPPLSQRTLVKVRGDWRKKDTTCSIPSVSRLSLEIQSKSFSWTAPRVKLFSKLHPRVNTMVMNIHRTATHLLGAPPQVSIQLSTSKNPQFSEMCMTLYAKKPKRRGYLGSKKKPLTETAYGKSKNLVPVYTVWALLCSEKRQ
jgi:hypothetical protein